MEQVGPDADGGQSQRCRDEHHGRTDTRMGKVEPLPILQRSLERCDGTEEIRRCENGW